MNSFKCGEDGCLSMAKSAGFCIKHYKLAWYHNVEKPKRQSMPKEWFTAWNAEYSRSDKGRFSKAKASAKSHNKSWSLDFDTWMSLLKTGCHYCQGPLNLTGSGLDRLDNSIGYQLDNVVPCCLACNMIRGTNLTSPEMVAVAALLKSLRKAA